MLYLKIVGGSMIFLMLVYTLYRENENLQLQDNMTEQISNKTDSNLRKLNLNS